jgi:hypothetical protein
MTERTDIFVDPRTDQAQGGDALAKPEADWYLRRMPVVRYMGPREHIPEMTSVLPLVARRATDGETLQSDICAHNVVSLDDFVGSRSKLPASKRQVTLC